MTEITVVWAKDGARFEPDSDLAASLPAERKAALLAKQAEATYRFHRVSNDVVVEVPAPDWGHGDILVYLPRRGWLVRRNYVDDWYIDIGMLKPLTAELSVWSDLWLDVVVADGATTYKLLDSDELAQAIEAGRVSQSMVAYTLTSLHSLLEMISNGEFPPPAVTAAIDQFGPA